MKKKKRWEKKKLSIGIAIILSSTLLPLSARATNEYTVLGIGKFNNLSWGDQLSNADAIEFQKRMDAKKWTRTAAWYDTNVYYTDMTTYGNESDILYITSHGNSNGDIALSDFASSTSKVTDYVRYDRVGGTGYLQGNVNGVDGAFGDAEWFIFASCQTINNSNWAKQLKYGVHHIFGYVGNSSDTKDTPIVDNFLDRAWGVNGYSPETLWSAWINANRTYKLNVWAIIGHNNNVYDFIHGVSSGARPDPTSNTDVYRWSDGGSGVLITVNLSSFVKSVNEVNKPTDTTTINQLSDKYLYDLKTKREKIDQSIVQRNLLGLDFQSTKNNEDKSTIYSSQNGVIQAFSDNSFVYSRQIKNERIMISQEKVKEKVIQFIEKNGGMRNDLVLASIIPTTQVDEEGNEFVIGYNFTFKQTYNNTIIDGDLANGIEISYDSDGVNFYMRDLKEISSKSKLAGKKVKQPKDILENARNPQNTPLKSIDVPNYKEISLVYYSYPFGANKNKLIPAYKLNFENTSALFYDAITGELLDGAAELNKDRPQYSEPTSIDKNKYVIPQFSTEE